MNTILVITLIIVAFLFIQLLPFIRAREMQGRQTPGLSDLFTEQQRRQKRLLLYIWSPRCGMCLAMTPIIDELARQREDVVSIDAAQNPEIARRLKIMATPALVVLADGKIDKVLLGARSGKTIQSLLN